MRVFVTGASGFVGSKVVKELKAAGHAVLGLARSDASASALRAAGAEVHRGDLGDPASLRVGASSADAVMHLAFDHDFSKFAASCEQDHAAIAAIGDALVGTGKRLVVTSGTGMVRVEGRPNTEDDPPRTEGFPRTTELAAAAVAERGVPVAVMRLPQVHDALRAGLVSFWIEMARQHGYVAYVGRGENRWAAAHVDDVARLYLLALEKGGSARYHAVAEEGVAMTTIADVLRRGLKLPLRSITHEEAPGYFGWMAHLAGEDACSSSEKTRAALGWRPTGPTLIEDLERFAWTHPQP